MPMPAYLPFMGMGDPSCLDDDEILMNYFIKGYTNLDIVAFINNLHDLSISLSTLKKSVRKMTFK